MTDGSSRAASRGYRVAMPRPSIVLACLAACSPAPEAPRHDLAGALAGDDCVLVVLDALHAGFVSSYGSPLPTSPHIDALAARGVRFARAWSQTSWTLPSTASLMTGLYQETHGVRFREQALPDEARALAELFSGAGYRTRAFVQNPYAGEAYGFGQGFDEVTEAFEATAAETVRDVLAYLGETPRAPAFVYLHLRRPHSPYDPDPEHLEPFLEGGYDGPVTGSNEDIERHNDREAVLRPADVRHPQRLYAGGIRQADAALGTLFEGLDEARTLIAVTSDHGDGMNQHGRLGHNWYSFEEMIHVPLVLAHPALPGGTVVEAPVMTIDVLPTLAELFGLPRPALVQGVSLVETMATGRALPRPAIFTSSRTSPGGVEQRAAFDGRFKYLVTDPGGRGRLFDLIAEPAERTDVADEHPDARERLARLLEAWQQQSAEQALGESVRADADEEMLGKLRALGYLGGDR